MINYSQNLENVRNSKCVLDIVQRGQSGLTLRPIEALLNSKKLITDNVAVERYDFYDPRNIFILGKDDESRIKEFVDSPFVEVPESVIEKYEFGNWLNCGGKLNMAGRMRDAKVSGRAPIGLLSSIREEWPRGALPTICLIT